MDWNSLALPVMALATGALAFAYVWMRSRAFDRKYGHRPPVAGE